MVSCDWGKPIYFSCEWWFSRYIVHIYTSLFGMRVLSVPGVRNICYSFGDGAGVISTLLHLRDSRTKDHRCLQRHRLLLTRTKPRTEGDTRGAGSRS